MSSNSDNKLEKFQTNQGELKLVRLLGKGKSGYSYLASVENTKVVLKIMHDEPCAYYSFSGNKTELEVNSYNQLEKLKIPMPQILEYNFDKNYIVKEFIDGPTATEMIIQNQIKDSHIRQIFKISNNLKHHDLNIDFFPSNFVIENEKVYYIDYESNKYLNEWSLENWGIYYWANSEGFEKFAETGNAKFINSNLEKGIPIKEPFIKKVNQWIVKFSES